MKRYLWKFYWNCGRSGEVEGLFVATEDEINNAIGKQVIFGEILGKHSEIFGDFGKEDIEKLDLDFETVEKVSKILGKTWSGYNPLNYVRYDCEKCGLDYYSDEFNQEKNMCVYCAEEESEE